MSFIGKGSFGYVKKAQDKTTNEIVAIKFISKDELFAYRHVEYVK